MSADQKQALLQALEPILKVVQDTNPASPNAQKELATRFPIDGPELREVEALVRDGLSTGWLVPREANGVRFGRLAKPAQTGFSIDAVDMSGPGPGHTHPNGEIDLCFAIEGDARFDGNPPGWTVYPPGSWHVPTVSGGRMGILYFLRDGAIQFGPNPNGAGTN